ncbi:MAG: type IV pili twitching motility protein PilT, partial [Myxococcota bacterium]
QIRAQLSFVLQAVVSQVLLPRPDGPGRVMGCEVMIPNHAIRNLIREDKVHQIYSTMQMGQGRSGMQTMNQSFFELYMKGLVSIEEILARSADPAELQSMIEHRSPLAPGARR